MPTPTTRTSPVSDEFIQAIELATHRVVSLDAELKELGAARLIREGDYNRRSRAIRRLGRRLDAIQAQIVGSGMQPQAPSDRDALILPRNLTPEERQKCETYLQEKKHTAQYATNNMELIAGWVTKALGAPLFSLTSILRLSRLRRLVSSLDRKIALLFEARNRLEERLSRAINAPGTATQLDSTRVLQDMMILFHRLESTTLEIAATRSSLKGQRRTLDAMDAIIEKKRKDFSKIPTSVVPTPNSILSAFRSDDTREIVAESTRLKAELKRKFSNSATRQKGKS